MDLFSSPPRSSQQHTRQRTATANSPQASTVKVPPTTPSTPSKRQQLNRRSRLSPAKVKTSHEWGTAGGFIDWDVDEDEGGGGPSPGRNPQQRVRTRLGSAVEPFLLPTRLSPLDVPELLTMILQTVIDDSPTAALACVLVCRHWFDIGAVLLWRNVRYEDCNNVFDWATNDKKIKRNNRILERKTSVDPLLQERMMAYTKAVHSVHITEVVEPGTSVDVMILRNCYPQMLPFSNLRSVVLHRLSPSAFYKEEFVYTVKFPEMWLDLSATKCTHQLDILSSSTASPETRYITIPPAALAVPRDQDPATLVWIQTSVFVHYQHLTDFCLQMPPSWSLERQHASELLRSISESPNGHMLRRLVLSGPIPSSSSNGGANLLTALPNLEHVELECGIDDRVVRTFARAWANLRSFTLRAPPLRDPKNRSGDGDVGEFLKPKITINSLRYLMFYNHHLTSIALDLLPVPYPPHPLHPLTPVKIPIFRPDLQLLHITGWNSLPEKFIFAFASKSIPATCDFRLKQVAMSGVGSLFGEEDDWGWGEKERGEEEWRVRIGEERERKEREERGEGERRGWEWL